MTSLLDRFTAPAGPEETRVTNPPPAPPRGVPWWAGVYGLDPAVTAEAMGLDVPDWALAGQCTAMACAVCVFGADAGWREKWVSRKGSPVAQFLGWLLEAGEPVDAARRRLALRLACDQTQAMDADGVLEDARRLHDSCTPRRR